MNFRLRSWFGVTIPVLLVSTGAYLLFLAGERGQLGLPFLRDQIYARLETAVGWVTGLKLQSRGQRAPHSKIVIAAIDLESIKEYGRWPWSRDRFAAITRALAESGAHVIALDLIGPEPHLQVSAPLRAELEKRGLKSLADRYETDPQLVSAVRDHSSRVVGGWVNLRSCQLAYEGPYLCLTKWDKEDAWTMSQLDKYRLWNLSYRPEGASPIQQAQSVLFNFRELQDQYAYAGFNDIDLDRDGFIRRTAIVKAANGRLVPSFSLAAAKLAMKEDIDFQLGDRNELRMLRFMKSGKEIPVLPDGRVAIHFRGGPRTFPYLPVKDLLSPGDKVQIETHPETHLAFDCKSCAVSRDEANQRVMTQVSKAELLKDAIVLVGVTAPLYDMKPIPMDQKAAGVITHAHLIDSLIAGDLWSSEVHGKGWILLLLLLTAGAIGFAAAIGLLSAVPAVLICVGVPLAFWIVDFKVLFPAAQNWNTGFLYFEYVAIATAVLVNRYVIEEGRRKFLKQAFSRYVSPQVVKMITRDPRKLELGGVRKDLTVLFSDIRGFMPLTERMDPQKLLQFLQDYHQIVAQIVTEKGTLDKYVGDSVMAFWGAPLDQPKHAHFACQAAVKMVQELGRFNPDFQRKYGESVTIGVGINSGPVTVGNVGSSAALSYTAIGNDVNLASRVERLTRLYRVNILTTSTTMDAIRECGEPLPGHRFLDRVQVKGSDHAVDVIQVLEKPYPAEALKAYQEGWELYERQKWDEAIVSFIRAQSVLTEFQGYEDAACRVLVERSQKFKQAPPPADWDRAWALTRK